MNPHVSGTKFFDDSNMAHRCSACDQCPARNAHPGATGCATDETKSDTPIDSLEFLPENRVENHAAPPVEKVPGKRSLRCRVSDRIDEILCRPILGAVLVMVLLAGLFQLTFRIADGWRYIPIFSGGNLKFTTPVAALAELFHRTLPDLFARGFGLGEESPWLSFLREGVFAGVGGVVQFVPVIFVLFAMLAVLEQSGIVPRIARMSDRLMRRFHLAGGSILPMVLAGGFTGGCAVPAILAAGAIPHRRPRLLTILVLPMLHCGGKLPVYVLIIAAFFPTRQGLVLAGLVAASWGIALVTAGILGAMLVRGENPPMEVELPPYRIPRLREILSRAAGQCGDFLKKAGTVVLVANILLWVLMIFPRAENAPPTAPRALENSYAGKIGKTLEPISRFAGFDWKDNVALLSGLATKELIVSSMATLHWEEAATPSDAPTGLPDGTWPKALAILVFVMLYAPCTGTLVTMGRFSGSWKWPLFALVLNTTLAFLFAVAIYQGFTR